MKFLFSRKEEAAIRGIQEQTTAITGTQEQHVTGEELYRRFLTGGDVTVPVAMLTTFWSTLLHPYT